MLQNRDYQILPLRSLIKSINRGLSSSYVKEGDIPVLRLKAKDIKDTGRIITSKIDQESVRSIKDVEKARVFKGDVLLTLKGTNFKTAVVTDDKPNLVISANIISLTLSDIVKPEYVAAYLNSDFGQKELQKRAGGSVVQTLNRNLLMEVMIPVPPLVEQEKISRLLETVKEYQTLLEREMVLISKLSNVVINRKVGFE